MAGVVDRALAKIPSDFEDIVDGCARRKLPSRSSNTLQPRSGTQTIWLESSEELSCGVVVASNVILRR